MPVLHSSSPVQHSRLGLGQRGLGPWGLGHTKVRGLGPGSRVGARLVSARTPVYGIAVTRLFYWRAIATLAYLQFNY